MSKTIVKCIITGVEKSFNKTSLQKKIDKFGSIDMFHRFYVSKEAAKLLKKGTSIQEIRKLLKSSASHNVDIEVLFKLKLLKKGKRKTTLSNEERKALKETTEKNEREWYSLQEKMKTCQRTWVEEMTGGKNKCQVPYGGTCIRPDIYYDNEHNRDGRCKPCPFHEYCLCSNKEVT